MPYNNHCCAGVAHLVERDLAKVEVASSSLVARSKKTHHPAGGGFFRSSRAVARKSASAERKTCRWIVLVPVCVWRPGRAASEPRRPLQKTPPIKGGVFFGVSKTPRRVCRPQAAKNRNHFSPRHVRGENTSQTASVEFCRLRQNYARSRLQAFCRKNPEGFSTVSPPPLGTVVFFVYFSPCGVLKGRVSTSGSRRIRRKSWQKAAYS